MTKLKRIQTDAGLVDVYYKKTPKGTWISSMSGAIIAVEVAPGDTVKEGQDLVVMTAMKMEYRLKAPKDGVIKSVKCKLDDLVDIDDLLVSMEK